MYANFFIIIPALTGVNKKKIEKNVGFCFGNRDCRADSFKEYKMKKNSLIIKMKKTF